MLLLSYDGSADSRAAIAAAAKLIPGAKATVVTVWEPFAVLVAHTTFGPGYASYVPDSGDLDKHSEESAQKRATEGAEYAKEVGLDATARTCAYTTSIADAIIESAREVDADAIVMGTRGLTGLKSALLGSVSNAVLHHADKPVFVVPGPDAVSARAE